MAQALRASGRDIVFSLSNNASNSLFQVIGGVSPWANSWRISGDISDNWASLKSHGFYNDKWAPFSRPGHWNDPDMFEVGTNGGGKPKRLTADEQYTHVSLWCLLSAPLLLGCDLAHLDKFTLGLLTNDEVLDVNQDTLGKQATCVSKQPGDKTGDLEVFAKPLDDGTWAVGLFNLSSSAATVQVNWSDLTGVTGSQLVRDLWRQKDLGTFGEHYSATVASHGVVLLKVSRANS
jgi:alpha-galactosidase